MRRFLGEQLLAEHGDGVKLAVRAADSSEGASLGEVTSRGRVHCVGTRGPWLRVLYKGYKVCACAVDVSPCFQLKTCKMGR